MEQRAPKEDRFVVTTFSLYYQIHALAWELQSLTNVLARLPTFAVSLREIHQFASLPPIQFCLW